MSMFQYQPLLFIISLYYISIIINIIIKKIIIIL